MSMELMYDIRCSDFEKLSVNEQLATMKKLAFRVISYLDEIEGDIKNISRTDLELIPVRDLMQVENEALFLTVTLNKIVYLIEQRLDIEDGLK